MLKDTDVGFVKVSCVCCDHNRGRDSLFNWVVQILITEFLAQLELICLWKK